MGTLTAPEGQDFISDHTARECHSSHNENSPLLSCSHIPKFPALPPPYTRLPTTLSLLSCLPQFPADAVKATASSLGGWLSRLWPVSLLREPLGLGLEWSPSGRKEEQKGQPRTNGMKAGSGHGEGLLGEVGGLRSLRVFASCSCKGRERYG